MFMRSQDPHRRSHSISAPLDSRQFQDRPVLPSTSAEFNLFPNRNKPNPICRQSPPASDTAFAFAPDMDGNDATATRDLEQLRAMAFRELHRDVVGVEEGLILRMRDYEKSRSRFSGTASPPTRTRQRGRTRPTHLADKRSWDGLDVNVNGGDDDDDAMEIHSEEGGPRKKRALSLGLIDMSPFAEHGAQWSAGGNRDSAFPVSAFASDADYDDGIDDEISTHPEFRQRYSTGQTTFAPPSFTPTLSYTSTNSSMTSLPLSGSLSLGGHPSSGPARPAASRSEKALAALTLAIANGAGGLNDYHAVRAAQDPPAIDDAQVGELWH